ncbi:MAG: lipoyl synthase [Desulfovibrio sp.]|nr:lipoyl synthase [Desulfovibrio sp.]
MPLTEPSTAPEKTKSASRLPVWIRRPLLHGRTFAETKNQVNSCGIPTVCRNAKCPNMGECYSRGMATFLILGEVCTRNCAFCNIAAGLPRPLDPEEPARLAAAVAALQLHHTVITSVTRDDLEDGGAAHFAACILAVRKRMPSGAVEVLVPDFRGSLSAIQTVLDAAPHVLTHNVETHPSLYSVVRPMADYRRSLDLLRHAARAGKAVAKSGFMVGLGETDEHVREILADLMEAGCRIVTVGQYLQPSRTHLPVARFVHPDDFVKYASWGREVGIPFVFSAPLVRSSYQARESFGELNVEIPVSPSEACRAGGRKRGLRQKSSRRPG